MYRYKSCVCALMLGFSASVAHAEQPGQHHFSKDLAYLTCTGEKYRMTWEGNGFHHWAQDGHENHVDSIALYQTWGGGCWALRWDGKNQRFIHSNGGRDGPSHPEKFINYITPDGNYWTGMRSGNEWLHIFIKNAPPSGSDFDIVVRVLKNPANRKAMQMVVQGYTTGDQTKLTKGGLGLFEACRREGGCDISD
jgi:hypothetical protein